MPVWTLTHHHAGGPDAEGVLRERGGDPEAKPAGPGSETGGGPAESRRAGDAPLQEGTPHRRAEEVPGGCEVSSKVSLNLQVLTRSFIYPLCPLHLCWENSECTLPISE